MFISSLSEQIQAKRAELSGITKIPPANEREKKRYQYLFQSSQLHSNKTLYRHVVGLVNQFISQVMGRQEENSSSTPPVPVTANNDKPRQVRGVADRMPRLVDPNNPEPRRDSIFLGEAKDYPAAVIAIEYDGSTKPVFYEGNQIVARHLHLDCEKNSVSGKLVLNDGTRLPVEIMIITAV
ncbi:MAG: hypothetical protein ACPGSM_12030 [Thiolinea sp.]